MVRAHYVYASIALISSPCVARYFSRALLLYLLCVACGLFLLALLGLPLVGFAPALLTRFLRLAWRRLPLAALMVRRSW